MDILAYTAWPITVLTIIFLMREKLGDLIGRLLRIKHKETEVEFSKTVNQIENKAIDLVADDTIDDISKENERLKKVAAVAPKSAISQAWNVLDRNVTDFIITSDLKPIAESITEPQVYKELKRIGFTNEDIITLKQLRSIRNRAMSKIYDLSMSYEQIESYIDLSLSLARRIKK